MQQSQSEKYLALIKPLGLFRFAQAKAKGVPQSTLSWLVSKAEVIKIGSDAYHHKDIIIKPEEEEFAIACLLFGKGAAIGGASALFYYNLIEQIPNQTWVLVDPKKTTHNEMYRLIRTKTNLSIGIDTHKWFRIASIERAIVDAFRFKSKLGGLEMAIKAARSAVKEKQTTPRKIIRCAEALDWNEKMLDYWEAITLD